MIINNLSNLAEMLSVDADDTLTDSAVKRRIERTVYKYTDCGAWIAFTDTGIKLGSIIEGYDGDGTSIFALDYPFEETDYRAAEAAIEKEAAAIWDWVNLAHYNCECGWHGTEDSDIAEEAVTDWMPYDDEHGNSVAKCPKCGKGVVGKTAAEEGIDFPDIWVEHQHLKGFSSPW